jgi:putative addiction module component (TIGR02574 family)
MQRDEKRSLGENLNVEFTFDSALLRMNLHSLAMRRSGGERGVQLKSLKALGRKSVAKNAASGIIPVGRIGGGIMKTKDLIAEATSLPVEERAMVVDSLLKSLNPPETEIDKKWAAVARRRLEELRSGLVKAVPGDQVFEKIREKYSK